MSWFFHESKIVVVRETFKILNFPGSELFLSSHLDFHLRSLWGFLEIFRKFSTLIFFSISSGKTANFTDCPGDISVSETPFILHDMMSKYEIFGKIWENYTLGTVFSCMTRAHAHNIRLNRRFIYFLLILSINCVCLFKLTIKLPNFFII